LVTRGELRVKGKEYEAFLQKGESAFIPAIEKENELDGDFTLYAAGLGSF